MKAIYATIVTALLFLPDPAMLLDIAGTGEIADSPHKFYGASNPDEEVA